MGRFPWIQLCTCLIVAIASQPLPVSGQVVDTPDWCPDDGTGTIVLPSGNRCNLCPPGTYVKQDCTADNPNPQCEPCQTNRYYSPCYNYERRCRSCSDCSPLFNNDGRNGMVDGEECTPTRDRVCRCRNDSFWNFEVAGCRMKALCNKGFGVARIATYKADTVCIECGDGTYSDEESLTQQCQTCTDCGDRTPVQQCNKTQNAWCDDLAPQVPQVTTSIISAHSQSVSPLPLQTDKPNIGAIIGGSLGGLLLLLLLAGCCWWQRRRRPDKNRNIRRSSQPNFQALQMGDKGVPPSTTDVPPPPVMPPATPDQATWTFPKKISDDGCCRPLMDTQDPGPPNNAHDVYDKEANPHPLQPISLQPQDAEGPSGGLTTTRMGPVGSSNEDVSCVHNV